MRSKRSILALAALLLLLGGAILFWGLPGVVPPWRDPVRVLLVTPAQAGDGSGLEPGQARALGALVQDGLEVAGGLSVTPVSALPANLEALRGQSRTLILVLAPRRQGDDLALGFKHVWGHRLGTGAIPWVEHAPAPAPPLEALRAFYLALPEHLPGAVPEGLFPRGARTFWSLVQASTWRLRNEHLDEALALAGACAQEEPGCASAWVLLGNLRYRRMLDTPAVFRQEQAETENHLRRGLALVPAHPRAAFLLSLLKADNGDQRQALDILVEARQRQPRNPTLLTGVAYAARGAGLLPLARRAMDLRDRMAFSEVQPQALDITCLYTGEVDRFERSLQEQPGHLRQTSGVLPFYRGYLALVQGDKARSREAFNQAAESSHGYPSILRLSRIFKLILEERREEAWTALREYDQERIGMREPDGEFTLRLAEAYALLGDRASAMEMANRAFSRGFGCTAWYERSPMLEPLRGLPKWKALVQHLKERQALMEDRFPISILDA